MATGVIYKENGWTAKITVAVPKGPDQNISKSSGLDLLDQIESVIGKNSGIEKGERVIFSPAQREQFVALPGLNLPLDLKQEGTRLAIQLMPRTFAIANQAKVPFSGVWWSWTAAMSYNSIQRIPAGVRKQLFTRFDGGSVPNKSLPSAFLPMKPVLSFEDFQASLRSQGISVVKSSEISWPLIKVNAARAPVSVVAKAVQMASGLEFRWFASRKLLFVSLGGSAEERKQKPLSSPDQALIAQLVKSVYAKYGIDPSVLSKTMLHIPFDNLSPTQIKYLFDETGTDSVYEAVDTPRTPMTTEQHDALQKKWAQRLAKSNVSFFLGLDLCLDIEEPDTIDPRFPDDKTYHAADGFCEIISTFLN